MNGDQYREAHDKLGISINAGARLLELNPRTSRRYSLGELPVPPLIAVLLTLMLRMGLTPADIERIKGEAL